MKRKLDSIVESQKNNLSTLLSALQGSSLVPRLTWLAPRSKRTLSMIPTTLASTLTSTMRMIYWIHSHSSNYWFSSHHRLCLAFLSFWAPWLGFDTIPIVARHREWINFSAPEGSLIKHYLDVDSFKIFAQVPAAWTSLPPWPGWPQCCGSLIQYA